MTVGEVQVESAKDQELSVVRECIVTKEWAKCELLIPKALRNHVLKLAHEGHHGIVKMEKKVKIKGMVA